MRILYPVILIQLTCYGWPISESEGLQIIEMVIESLEKIVDYYKLTYKFMNMDGIFGLKIAEGQLSLILRGKEEFKIPPHDFLRIQNIYIQTVNLSSLALPYLKKRDETYYERAHELLQPWEIWLEQRELDETLIWEASLLDLDFRITETMSDHCLGELMNKPRRCIISPECFDIMLRKKGARGYTVAHQVLYTHVVHIVGCKEAVNRRLSRTGDRGLTLSDWENELCANVFAAVTEKLVVGMQISSQQDLFMEEIFVCRVLGFPIFNQPSFARKIMTWQDPSGCFSSKFNSVRTEASRMGAMGRALLEEKGLANGCLAHKTSIALGTLSVLLHSFLENDKQFRRSRVVRPSESDIIDVGSNHPSREATLKPVRLLNQVQWTLPSLTVVLSLVLLWRIRAFRLCNMKKSGVHTSI